MAEPVLAGPVVGNDVVDLDDPRTSGKADDVRFVDRVLAPEEHARLASADDRDVELWRCWGAKEAAYKVVSKLAGTPPVFVHRDFVSSSDSVLHQGVRYPLAVELHGCVLHAVACAGAAPADTLLGVEPLHGGPVGGLEDLLPRFTPREADAIHSLASAAVRLSARGAAARALGVQESRLEIVCAPGPKGRRPPRLLLDGKPAPADVSLSHHGDWVGWALLLL